ncbi:rCG32815, isoform CRA_a [Rattus norvegicus]|uniref:Thymidine kinase n=1 Tax=Rattus norvegicus TaxID=10116 RepID=A6HL30_RAT|nr:rCG32815, isoform CRA_a [Rattus norvegicus]
MSYINLPTVLPISPSKTRGQIQVILGPMFSGKSTELMRRVRRFQIAQYKCLVIKYAKDTRYSNSFSTHDRNTMDALPACMLKDVAQEALGVAVIGIDEGQFFPDIVDFCETMANTGKTVIVAALDGTFQRKAFGSILNLVPLAESVVKLTAVCMECFRELLPCWWLSLLGFRFSPTLYQGSSLLTALPYMYPLTPTAIIAPILLCSALSKPREYVSCAPLLITYLAWVSLNLATSTHMTWG